MAEATSNTSQNDPMEFATLYDTPLDDGHIRLVRIHPDWLAKGHSPEEAQVHIQVVRVKIADIPAGDFCALSYCWGSDTATRLIRINNTPVIVRANIYGFLLCWYQRTLAGHKPEYLWIDQFCINQQDTVERAREVQRMDLIYREASMVVCWLGAGTKTSDEAMDLLVSLAGQPLVDFEDQKADRAEGDGDEFGSDYSDNGEGNTKGGEKARPCGSVYSDDEDFDLDLPDHEQRYLSGLRAVCVLVARPYFRRMWCVQETALATSESIILCGDRMAPFASLFRLWLRQVNSGWITFRQRYFPWDLEYDTDNMNYEHFLEYDAFWSGTPLKFIGIIARTSNNRLQTGRTGCNFLLLLIATHHYKCEEPLDKFYSLLKLSGDADQLIPVRTLAGHKPEYLWIDQFCINQQDTVERAREVQRMDLIYREASMVVCWLGAGTKTSDEAMDLLVSLAGQPLVDFEDQKADRAEGDGDEFGSDYSDNGEGNTKGGEKARPCGSVYSDDEDFDLDLPDHEQRYLSGLRAVCVLVARPYFRRMWCVQETALATSESIILCGDRMAPFASLFRLWLRQVNSGWITFRQRYFPWDLEYDTDNMNYEHFLEYDAFWSGTPLKFIGIIARTSNNRLQTGRTGCNFLLLLIATHHYKCEEPLDKFYSLLKLSGDADQLIPVVDYTQSFKSVSTNFVRTWIRLYNRLDIIAAVLRDGTDDRDMPTWVPEWQQRPLHNTLISRWPHIVAIQDDLEHKPLYNANGGIEAAYRFWSSSGPHPTEALLAVGLSCDTVYDLGEHNLSAFKKGNNDIFPASWRQVLERHIVRSNADAELRDDLWKRFLGVVLGGRAPDGSPFDYRRFSVEDLEDETRFQVDIGNGRLGMETWMEPQWETITSGRRFVVTKRGRMGLVTWFAQPGDEIVSIFGCSVPLVIRRLADGTCKLIGDCYIDGIMRGEIIDAAGGPVVNKKKADEILEEFDRLVASDGQSLPDELFADLDEQALEPELFGIR
nr:heterokaryon incompatibility protein 6, or allele [Quercus suber]